MKPAPVFEGNTIYSRPEVPEIARITPGGDE
jgi:hypothetical protein